MPFFKPLADIGITRQQLANFTDEDIIRTEKKLIAENRLNNSISKNDIEQILRLLKEYPDVIRIISNYECLHGILINEDAEHIDTLKRHRRPEALRIRYVVSNYFYDDVVAYINYNCKTNNWNNLRVLLYYHDFLTTRVTEYVSQKLTDKLDTALALLNEKPIHKVLREKIPYLTMPDFYLLLTEVDGKYFIRYLYSLLLFLPKDEVYVTGTRFFEEMLTAMRVFASHNRDFGRELWQAVGKYKKKSALPVIIMLMVIGLIVLSYVLTVTGRSSNDSIWAERKNALANQDNQQYSMYNSIDYLKEEQKVQMENFVEARLYPLNYPLNSWKAYSVWLSKYQAPFQNRVFDGNNADIKQGVGRSISIFNNTNKECIVIAYCYGSGNGSRANFRDPPQIYALYLPHNDSLKLDARMALFRFYMGRDLRGFNAYRHFVYPDSADLKFARFTKADSMLFGRAFIPGAFNDGFKERDNGKKRQQNADLVISQPSADIYKIGWTGDSPLYQDGDWVRYVTHDMRDSVTTNKPLILDLKYPFKKREDELEINSFLQGAGS